MSQTHIAIDREAIAAFCLRHQIQKLSLFGSVLRDDFHEGSDLDVLVEFKPGKTPSLFKIMGMEDELSELFGRRIDLRTPEELSQYFRDRVLSEAEALFVSG